MSQGIERLPRPLLGASGSKHSYFHHGADGQILSLSDSPALGVACVMVVIAIGFGLGWSIWWWSSKSNQLAGKSTGKLKHIVKPKHVKPHHRDKSPRNENRPGNSGPGAKDSDKFRVH